MLVTFYLWRFEMELELHNQQSSGSPSEVEEETVKISDDYAMLSQSLDDILADEGFAEMDSSKVLVALKFVLWNFSFSCLAEWVIINAWKYCFHKPYRNRCSYHCFFFSGTSMSLQHGTFRWHNIKCSVIKISGRYSCLMYYKVSNNEIPTKLDQDSFYYRTWKKQVNHWKQLFDTAIGLYQTAVYALHGFK